jgi:hypothetical protein
MTLTGGLAKGSALAVLLGLAAGCQTAPKPVSVAKPLGECFDALAAIGVDAPTLTAQSCRGYFNVKNTVPITTYQLLGGDAYDVSVQLSAKTGMPGLIKDCCQWASFDPVTSNRYGAFTVGAAAFKVRMNSKTLKLGWDPSADIKADTVFEIEVAQVPSLQ